MKSRIFLILLVLVFVLTMSLSAAGREEKPDVLHFALITKALNNPFWDAMGDGARQLCEERGWEFTYLAPTDPMNLEEQNRMMDDVIARRVDGIVLAPVDSDGVVPAIERANRAGIPVAVSATDAFGGDVVTYTGTDNYEGMKIVAEYMAEKLGGEGRVIVLDGMLGASVGQDRRRGTDEVLNSYPNIEIVARQDAHMQRAPGLEITENLIEGIDDFDAIIAANDEMALGAVEALDAVGLLDRVMVSGFDGNQDALASVRAGRMECTLIQLPGKMAADAILAIVDHMEGKDVPRRLPTDMVLATQENIDEVEADLDW